MELKMELFQKLNSVMLILHHLIEQKIVLIPIACTMEAIDINNNSKLPKVKISLSLVQVSIDLIGWVKIEYWKKIGNCGTQFVNFLIAPPGIFQLEL